MLPTSIISALSVIKLDVGHHVGIKREMPVGGAVLTATLQGSGVRFSLDSCILRPSDPTDTLLLWLNRHLMREGVTITGYQLDDAVALLDRLPGAQWSPVLRTLAGCGNQYVLDLSARLNGDPVTFQQACTHSQILCAPTDAGRRFASWMRSDVYDIQQDAQVDAIASFRLVIRRLAMLNPVARGVAGAMAGCFATWLEEADCPAAKAHVADLLFTAD
ncbi:hypothetical protein [Sphingomonas sp. NPDC079357]|uniref:hypothetical protein n=1 Tax=Sphingomonas sp. NPDC079357 TaxID=3364518 RepID=UPI0038504A15